PIGQGTHADRVPAVGAGIDVARVGDADRGVVAVADADDADRIVVRGVSRHAGGIGDGDRATVAQAVGSDTDRMAHAGLHVGRAGAEDLDGAVVGIAGHAEGGAAGVHRDGARGGIVHVHVA